MARSIAGRPVRLGGSRARRLETRRSSRRRGRRSLAAASRSASRRRRRSRPSRSGRGSCWRRRRAGLLCATERRAGSRGWRRAARARACRGVTTFVCARTLKIRPRKRRSSAAGPTPATHNPNVNALGDQAGWCGSQTCSATRLTLASRAAEWKTCTHASLERLIGTSPAAIQDPQRTPGLVRDSSETPGRIPRCERIARR